MNLFDESDTLQLLADLIHQLVMEQDCNPVLKERVMQLKMKEHLPSLFELINLPEQQKPLDASIVAELRVELCDTIQKRLQLIHKLLLSPEEQDLLADHEQEELIENRLQLIGDQLGELERLDKQEEKSIKQIKPNLDEFINIFEFLLIDHGLKFRIEHEKKTIEALILKAQSLLVQCRYRDTKKAFDKYGNKETVDELKQKREQLENKNKLLKMRLKEVNENNHKFAKLDANLRQELLDLKTELERKKWALSIGSKDSV